ncbi:lytic transglycosylase domain-containing protein [Paenibacillus sp. N1-5-1-14]|uniref:lytic transglycosylase domain-containing protein n=1 Tax=Paenibacillus radicibacter TaxID=2972488 RepID=UPI002159990A|nr:lytic transglycosylase domain-containing protein [Paenibacillus radicibacter]MCR8643745.1 lytic transglycosylase domain-containing protein [Paenibacillus radicibacter]
MSFFRKKRFFAMLLLIITFTMFVFSDVFSSLLYPIHYKEEIKKHATTYNVDPLLVAAIIRVESNYKPNETSKKGALGLMQLMPETAKWINEFGRLSGSMDKVMDADFNIQMGSWYVNFLLNQYNGDMVMAVAAYNAGQGNVKKWIMNGVWDGTEKNSVQIPYGETRHFVQRVLYYYHKYYKLYGESWYTA